MATTIKITIEDDLGMSEGAIYDTIDVCMEYELNATDYKIFIDTDD